MPKKSSGTQKYYIWVVFHRDEFRKIIILCDCEGQIEFATLPHKFYFFFINIKLGFVSSILHRIVSM